MATNNTKYYSLRFATKDEYLASKASGKIYTTLMDSTYVSRAVVSYIEEIGRSVTDAINIIAPISRVQVGDCVLYNADDGKHYALKGHEEWDATKLGGFSYNATDWAEAGYTLLGWLYKREGKEGRILSNADFGALQYDSENTSDSKVSSYTSMTRADGQSINCQDSKSTRVCISLDWTDIAYTSNSYYNWPLLRDNWDTIMTAYGQGTDTDGWVAVVDKFAEATSGTALCYVAYKIEGGKLTIAMTGNAFSAGDETITVTYSDGETTVDITPHLIYPADWDYSFDKWAKGEALAEFPATSGVLTDMDGKRNTTSQCIASTKAVAPLKVIAYAIKDVDGNAIPGVQAGDWWIPSAGEWAEYLFAAKRLYEKGFRPANAWMNTSSQNGSLNWKAPILFATSSAASSNMYWGNKNHRNCRARGIAAFHID